MRSASPAPPSPASEPGSGPAPLVPLLAFTALNSAAAGTTTLGIFFLTRSAFGFSAAQNYALGLLMGVTYVAGALAAGPLLRALLRRGGLEPRGALLAGALALAALCVLPWSVPRAWTVFALTALYSPLCGAFWPIVESYVSGARHGARLHAAIGRFNVTWSSAVALSFWAVAPFVEEAPLAVFVGVGAAHLASVGLLLGLPTRPGRAAHAPQPPRRHAPATLLAIHRPLLAASYLALYAFSPYLPIVLTSLGVPLPWRTPLASVWMLARVGGFELLGRWHGWHGRRASAAAGVALLLAGFAAAVLAPGAATQLGGAGGLALLAAGLVAFGLGTALLYTAALAYALEVGEAEIEAGGSHEALIGAGYALGPLAGLAVVGSAELGLIGTSAREGALTASVALLVLGAAAWAWRAGRRAAAAAARLETPPAETSGPAESPPPARARSARA